jgi:hypothetical protein
VSGTQFAGTNISAIVVDPSNADHLYLTVNEVSTTNGPGGGIWESKDGGSTWNSMSLSSPEEGGPFDSRSYSFSALVMDPNDPNTVFAAAGYPGIDAGFNGVYRKSGMDPTFYLAGNFPQNVDVGRISLAEAPSDPNYLYAAVADPTNGQNLYQILKTTNALTPDVTAINWQALPDANRDTGPDQLFHGQGDYGNVITVDPTNRDTVYAAGYKVWYSTDGGQSTDGSTSWWQISQGVGNSVHDDQHAFAWIPGTHTLLVGTDGGLMQLNGVVAIPTPNSFRFLGEWTSPNQMAITQFRGVAYDQSQDTAFGGTQDNGTVGRVPAGGTTYGPLPLGGGDGGTVAAGYDGTNQWNYYFADADPISEHNGTANYMQLADQAGDPRWSGLAGSATTVNGKTVYTGDQKVINDAQGSDTSFTIAVNPDNPARILFTGNGLNDVYESTNGGATVTNVTPTFGNGTKNPPTAVAYGINNPDAAYMGVSEPGVQADLFVRSGPGPFPASDVSPPPTSNASATVAEIVVDPVDWQTAYLLLNDGEIWRTTDAGATLNNWTNLTGDLGSVLPGVDTISLVDPNPTQAGQGYLVAGGFGGVYALNLGFNDGVWQSVAQYLPNVQVTDLHYIQSADFLLAGTYGRGNWEVTQAASALYNAGPAALIVTGDDAQQNRIVIDSVPGYPSAVEIKVNGRVEYSAPASSVSSITVNEGAANDTVDVEKTFLTFSVTINEGTGSDTVNISPTAQRFSTIFGGGVTIYAPVFSGGGHILNVYDSNDTAGDTFTLTATTISDNRILGGTITFYDQQVINLIQWVPKQDAKSQGSTFNVQSTAAGTSTAIIGGSHSDKVNVGNSTDGVQDIAGALNIENPPGNNTVTVDDSADTLAPTFTLSTLGVNPADSQGDSGTWGQISGLPSGGLINYEYPDTGSLTLKAGGGATVNVRATGVPTNLVGNGPTTVNVGNSTDGVHEIVGTLNIENPPALTTVTVDDSANTSARKFTLSTLGANPADFPSAFPGDSRSDTWGQISGLASRAVINYEYDDTQSLTLKTGGGATVNVLATGPGVTTNLVGNGPTTVNVGDSTDGVQDILGTLNIENPPALTTVTVDDSANTSAPTFTLSTLGVNPADFPSDVPDDSRSDTWGQISGLPGGAVINYEYDDTQSLTLQTGAGATVNVLATGVTTNLVGNGPTTVNVGNSTDGVQEIVGTLNIENPPALSTVTVDDSADNSAPSFTLSTLGGNPADFPSADPSDSRSDTWGQIGWLPGGAVINYEYRDTQSLTLKTGAGATVNVLATGVTTNLVGNGPTTVNVGNATDGVQDIHGDVTVTNAGPNTSLTVDDSADQTGRTATLGVETASVPITLLGITGLALGATINYSPFSLAALTIDGGSGGNVFSVVNTAVNSAFPTLNTLTTVLNTQDSTATDEVDIQTTTGPMQVNNLAGALKVNVGSDPVNLPQSILDPIQGAVTVNGNANTTLNINDKGTTSHEWYDVSANQVLRYPWTFGQPLGTPTQTINYFNVKYLYVYGGSGSSGGVQDVLAAHSTLASTALTSLYGGSGPNEFVVSNGSQTLDDIQGPVALHGGGIHDFAEVSDGLNTVGHNYTLTAGRVQRDHMADVTYDGLGEVIVATADNPYVGHTASTINVQSTTPSAFTIVDAGNKDTVTVGSGAGAQPAIPSTLASIGQLQVGNAYAADHSSVVLDDSGDTQMGKQVAFNTDSYAWGVSGLSPGRIYFNLGTGSSVQALGGSPAAGQSGGNSYAIQSTQPGVALSVTGGTGNDTFVLTNTAPLTAAVAIDGGGGADTLHGPDIANTWQISGANAGSLDGNVSFASIQNLTGGAGNDTFQFQTGGSLAGKIDGGGGTNALDYSAYQGTILVDLLLNNASLIGQGVFNMANVTGSQGNSLIVGDAATTALTGGTGRNVLIGGGGTETITGGGGFNLLIGGSTIYDRNLTALQDLQQYWDNPNATTLDQLVNPLKSKKGVVVNGRLLMLNSSTVHDDNAVDRLIGGSGANWFIKDKEDTINNGNGPGPNDRLTVI